MRKFRMLKSEIKEPIFASFDIEANNWKNFEMAGVWDGNNYNFFTNLNELFDFILSHETINDFFAHNGGGYDFRFLFKYLRAKKIPYEVIYLQSRAAFVLAGGKFFSDSMTIFPFSLDKAAKAMGSSGKITGAIDFSKEKVNKNNKKHQEYLFNDCIILWDSLKKYFEYSGCGKVYSRASAAMKKFRREAIFDDIILPNKSERELCLEGYTGGRSEMFVRRAKNLNYYDINSLYPYAMTFKVFTDSLGCAGHWKQPGIHRVKVKVPENILPPLGVRREGKFLFPSGTFIGVFTHFELEMAENYGCEVLEFYNGSVFEEKDVFSNYIQTVYSERKKYKSGEPLNLLLKDAMNCLYGKFGEGEEKIKVKFSPDFPSDIKAVNEEEDGFYSWEEPKLKIPVHGLPQIAACVTSRARTIMYPYLAKAWECGSLYYTDTDSILTSLEFLTGIELGQLKLEGKYEWGEFLAPKVYRLKNKITSETRIKGLPAREAEKIPDTAFFEGKIDAKYDTLWGFRESLRSFDDFFHFGEKTKSISHKKVGKRVFIGDSFSESLKLFE